MEPIETIITAQKIYSLINNLDEEIRTKIMYFIKDIGYDLENRLLVFMVDEALTIYSPLDLSMYINAIISRIGITGEEIDIRKYEYNTGEEVFIAAQ